MRSRCASYAEVVFQDLHGTWRQVRALRVFSARSISGCSSSGIPSSGRWVVAWREYRLVRAQPLPLLGRSKLCCSSTTRCNLSRSRTRTCRCACKGPKFLTAMLKEAPKRAVLHQVLSLRLVGDSRAARYCVFAFGSSVRAWATAAACLMQSCPSVDALPV